MTLTAGALLPGRIAAYHRIQHRGPADKEDGMGEIDESAILTGIGQKIVERRNALAMSQTKLAELAELNRSFLNGVENGTRNPSVITLIRVAAALGTTAADLVTITDKSKRTKKH